MFSLQFISLIVQDMVRDMEKKEIQTFKSMYIVKWKEKKENETTRKTKMIK